MIAAIDAKIPLEALAPLVVVAIAWAAYCIVDIVKAERVLVFPKWAWALICVLSVPVGGIIYLLIGRER